MRHNRLQQQGRVQQRCATKSKPRFKLKITIVICFPTVLLWINIQEGLIFKFKAAPALPIHLQRVCALPALSAVVWESHIGNPHVSVHPHRWSYGWVSVTDCHQNKVMRLKPPCSHTHTQTGATVGEKIDGLEMVTETPVNPGRDSEQRVLNKYKTTKLKLYTA